MIIQKRAEAVGKNRRKRKEIDIVQFDKGKTGPNALQETDDSGSVLRSKYNHLKT